MNAVTGVVQFKKVVPQVYSVSFALRFPPRFRRVAKLLQDRLEKDLTEGGMVPDAADPSWTEHFQQMLKLTLLRHFRTRGRAKVGESPTPNDDERCRHLERKLLESFKCDTRLRKFGHHSPNAGQSMRQISTHAALAVTEAFLDGLELKPSASKWWALEPTQTKNCGLATTCKLFQRVGSVAFHESEPLENADDSSDDEEDAFQKYCRQQVQKAEAFASSGDADVLLVQTLWTAEPADALSKACQHDDLEDGREALFQILL